MNPTTITETRRINGHNVAAVMNDVLETSVSVYVDGAHTFTHETTRAAALRFLGWFHCWTEIPSLEPLTEYIKRATRESVGGRGNGVHVFTRIKTTTKKGISNLVTMKL